MALRPIFYDTETTGINMQNDRIVEIAAFDPEGGREFVELVNPGCPIPAEASAVHHITDEMVAGAADFSAVGARFIKFCQGDALLIAHNNNGFDLPFLRSEFDRHGLVMPSSWEFFDTLKWARRYRPDLPRHTLQYLREAYDIPENNAHRALDDVMVLYEVFTLMRGDLMWEEVHALLQKTVLPSCMPFGKYQGKPIADVPKDYINWLKGKGFFDKSENSELRQSFEKAGLI